MKRLMSIIILGTIFLFSNSNADQEDIFEWGQLYEISNFSTDSIISLGDTIQFEVDINCNHTGNAVYTLNFSGGFLPLGTTSGEVTVNDTTSLDTGATTKTYNLLVTSIERSEIHFQVAPETSPDPFGNPLAAGVSVAYKPDFDAGELVPYGGTPCEDGYNPLDEIDDNCRTYEKVPCIGEHTHPPTDIKIITVSGYYTFPDNYHGGVKKGAFNDMWLFFHKKNKPGDEYKLYHPVPSNEPIHNTHYAKCDENGFFFFSFPFKKDSLFLTDITAEWEILIFPAKENTAIALNSATNHWTIMGNYDLYQNPTTTGTPTFCHAFPVQFDLGTPSDSYTFPKPLVITLAKWGWEDGALLRNNEIARQFVLNRIGETDYNGWGFKQIDAYRSVTLDFAGQYGSDAVKFRSYTGNCRLEEAAHEYGHYVDDQCNGMDGRESREGFAMFNSFATRSWAFKNFSNETSSTSIYGENPETAPWFIYEGTNLDDGSKSFYYPRFGNMSKTYLKTRRGYDMSRWASMLWNLYDSFYDGTFMPLDYEGKNNDDIHNHGSTLYGLALSSLTNDHEQFRDDFKNAIDPGGNETTLRSGIDKIHLHMRFDSTNLKIPDNDNQDPRRMHAPSLDFTTTIDGGYKEVTWGATNTYNQGSQIKSWNFTKNEGKPTAEDWTFSYNYNFDNIEDGVKLYQKSGINWNLIEWDYLTSISEFRVLNWGNATYKVNSFNLPGTGTYIPNPDDDSYPDYYVIIGTGKISIEDGIINELEVQNTPNPFDNYTNFNFNVTEACHVVLIIYDQQGHKIETLLDKTLSSGYYSYDFNSQNLPSGNYFANLIVKTREGNVKQQAIKLSIVK